MQFIPIFKGMKGLNSALNFVILFICVAIGAGYFFVKKESKHIVTDQQPKLSNEQMDALVNKHLKKTIQQEQYSKALNQKNFDDLKAKMIEAEKMRRLKQDVENSKIPTEKQIWKESDVDTKNVQQKFGLEQNAHKNSDEMNEEEKKEYARQWIENARKGGYNLELSPDLQVIKYIPIRKPTQQQEDSVETNNTD